MSFTVILTQFNIKIRVTLGKFILTVLIKYVLSYQIQVEQLFFSTSFVNKYFEINRDIHNKADYLIIY